MTDLITDSNDIRLVNRDSEAMNVLRDSLRAALARFTAPIVCICGSTRFKQSWISENARLTGEGYIVLAVGLWGHHERVFPDEATKKKLDELHLRKIDLCDWVWVLDVDGYIGESTRNEIAYAEAHGKFVRYLSKEFPDYVEPVDPILAAKEKLERELSDEKQKVANLEEYMLKGVAFRDELQAQLCRAHEELGYGRNCRTVIYIQAELTRLRSIVSRVEDVEGIKNVIKDFWGAPSWKIAELVRDYAMGEG